MFSDINNGFKKKVLVFLVMILIVGGGYFVWEKYFSSEAKTQRNYEKYLNWQASYEKAMKEDIYGGKTPQETLDLFVAALKKGDVELASKYFVLNEAGNIDPKWINYLNKIKKNSYMSLMANDIGLKAKSAGSSYEGNYAFEIYNNDGSVAVTIEMKFNPLSKVWKIESL